MKDRVSTKILNNGATRYGVYDETGKLLRYEYIKLEDEPSTEGDFFNKANMLPDHIPALLGLKMENPQVKDALNVLANVGNLHVWERVQTYAEPVPEVPAGYTLGEVETDVQLTERYTENVTIEYSSSVVVDSSGNISLNGASSSTKYIPGWASNYTDLLGKFCKITIGTTTDKGMVIFYIPPDAKLTNNNYILVVSKYQSVTGYPYTPAIPAGTTTDYLTSTNRNAYPDNVSDAQDAYYTLGDVVSGNVVAVNSSSGTYVKVKHSSTLDVSEDGTISFPTTATTTEVKSTNSSNKESDFGSFKGKFVQFSTDYGNVEIYISAIIFIPENATFSGTNNVSVSYQPVTGHAAVPANTTITYLGQLGGGARIEVGSYVGTGTYGSSNPNSLYVGTNCVKVEIRAIYSSDRIGSPFLELHPQAATETWRALAYFHNGSLDGNSYMRIVDGVLYWYSNGVNAQGNENGVQHTYSIFKK